MTMPRKEQFSGCLIGQCLGDALGFPVEACLPHTTATYVNKLLRKSLVGTFGRRPYPFGQYTDDSQLARELMQSYVACQHFDPGDYAHRIAVLFGRDRIVGLGGATFEAAQRLVNGAPWEEAGTPPPSAGNGSAMRAAPIGLFFYDDPEQMIQAAHDQGRITHQDPRCSAGAVAIAGAVAFALQSETIDPERFLNQLSEWVRRLEPSVAEAIRRLSQSAALPPDEAAAFISIAGLEPGHSDPWVGISPFVTGSVLWSLYAFLRTPENYWETICTAITPGGDVDTTAAMAGAISGAHLGLQAIPADLAHRLTDQGTWGYPELVELADQCHELKMGQPGFGSK
jgi:poly(ADP-ribose) glycohydrolase ARH3